jgi:(p)ppGpp synthase/HD superfamily hydrolase
VSAARSNTADQDKAPVQGLGGKLWKLAPCCTPIPNDELLGHFIESSNTVHVHRKDCSHCQRGFRVDPENWKPFLWASELPAQFACKLDIDVYNAHETLELVTAIIAQNNSGITGFNMTPVSPDVSRLTLTIQVANQDHLSRIINRIREIEAVRLVSRHLERDHMMKPVDVEED